MNTKRDWENNLPVQIYQSIVSVRTFGQPDEFHHIENFTT